MMGYTLIENKVVKEKVEILRMQNTTDLDNGFFVL